MLKEMLKEMLKVNIFHVTQDNCIETKFVFLDIE